MLSDIAEEMKLLYTKDIPVDNDNFCIVYDHTKIVVFNKEQTPETSDSINKVSFSQLPDSVITQFSEFVKGLIPCATLNVIAAMREQTHKFLAIFNSSLDAPFVHHSLHADDDFAIKTISDEINTVLLGDKKANEIINKSSTDLWLQQFSMNPEELSRLKESKNAKNEKMFAQKICGFETALPWQKLSHLQCTIRDNFSRTYTDDEKSPILSFGTILELDSNGKQFFICLHPPCDSIRLTEPTEFIFACLYEGNGYADIIVQTAAEGFTELALKTNISGTKIRVCTIRFIPKSGETVISGEKREEWWFFETDGQYYKWLGEVRKEKASQLKQRAMANANRDGFDEFTWLRMRSSGQLKPYAY